MIIFLTALLGVLGAFALAITVYSGARILRRVPMDKRRRGFNYLLRWQFGALRQMGGDGVVRDCNRYLRAMMFLLGVVACLVIIWGFIFINSQNGPPEGLSLAAPASPQPGRTKPWVA